MSNCNVFVECCFPTHLLITSIKRKFRRKAFNIEEKLYYIKHTDNHRGIVPTSCQPINNQNIHHKTMFKTRRDNAPCACPCYIGYKYLSRIKPLLNNLPRQPSSIISHQTISLSSFINGYNQMAYQLIYQPNCTKNNNSFIFPCFS